MTATLLAFILGLFLGGGVGFLVIGVMTLENHQEGMEEAQRTIEKQQETIADLKNVIIEFRDLGDDGK